MILHRMSKKRNIHHNIQYCHYFEQCVVKEFLQNIYKDKQIVGIYLKPIIKREGRCTALVLMF